MSDLFPDAPQQVSLDRQIDGVKREIAMRQRAYPRWVVAGRLTQAKADTEIAVMQAVLATLERITP
mgnify:CR=1 FL=1